VLSSLPLLTLGWSRLKLGRRLFLGRLSVLAGSSLSQAGESSSLIGTNAFFSVCALLVWLRWYWLATWALRANCIAWRLRPPPAFLFRCGNRWSNPFLFPPCFLPAADYLFATYLVNSGDPRSSRNFGVLPWNFSWKTCTLSLSLFSWSRKVGSRPGDTAVTSPDWILMGAPAPTPSLSALDYFSYIFLYSFYFSRT